MTNIPSKPIDIAEIVVRRRQEAGITSKELAERANLSPAYISRIENGGYKNTSLSLPTVKALAEGLGLSLRALLEEMGILHNKEQPSYELITQSLRHMGYSDKDAEEVIRYARYVKGNTENN